MIARANTCSDVELIEPGSVRVLYSGERLDPLRILRLGGRFFVESTSEPPANSGRFRTVVNHEVGRKLELQGGRVWIRQGRIMTGRRQTWNSRAGVAILAPVVCASLSCSSDATVPASAGQELPVHILGAPDALIRAKDIEPAEDGSVWILNADEPWFIQMFATGEVIQSWGNSGGGPDDLRGPKTLVGSEDGTSVWALDGSVGLGGGSFSLVRIDDEAAGLSRFSIPIAGDQPIARYADPDAYWIQATSDGFLLATADAGVPVGLRTWRAELVEFLGDSIREVGFSPARILDDPSSRYPDGSLFLPFPLWARCPDGTFVLYDPLQNTVRRFGPTNDELESVSLPPERAYEITFDRVLTMAYPTMAAAMPEMDSAAIATELRTVWEESQRQIAGTFPEYGDLRCPVEGEAWFQLFALEGPSFGSGRGPEWLRVSADGAIESFRFPITFMPLRFTHDRIWGVHRNELGVESVAWVELP